MVACYVCGNPQSSTILQSDHLIHCNCSAVLEHVLRWYYLAWYQEYTAQCPWNLSHTVTVRLYQRGGANSDHCSWVLQRNYSLWHCVSWQRTDVTTHETIDGPCVYVNHASGACPLLPAYCPLFPRGITSVVPVQHRPPSFSSSCPCPPSLDLRVGLLSPCSFAEPPP